MSWFECRTQAAQEEAEAEPVAASPMDTAPGVGAAPGAAASAADDAIYTATQLAAADAPLFDDSAGATQVISCDYEHALVKILGRELRLDLRFPSDEIEPMFSGGCWAGSVVWSASLVLCDVIAEAAAAPATESPDDNGSGLPVLRGRRVLELGAGVALPSLTAHLAGAGAVLLTEQPTVASLLQRTVADHFPTASPDLSGDYAGWIAATSLDWTEVAAAAGDGSAAGYKTEWPEACRDEGWGWDVILCSDCVYEPLYGDSWRLLSATLRVLLLPGSGSGSGSGAAASVERDSPVAVVALERRRADGAERFLDSCREWGAEVVLERRLRLPNRWGEGGEGGDGGEGGKGGDGEAGESDDEDTAALKASSAGVIEVYLIRHSAVSEPVADADAGVVAGRPATPASEVEWGVAAAGADSGDSDSDDDDGILFS